MPSKTLFVSQLSITFCFQWVFLKHLLIQYGKPLKDYELWALCHECLLTLETYTDYPGMTFAIFFYTNVFYYFNIYSMLHPFQSSQDGMNLYFWDMHFGFLLYLVASQLIKRRLGKDKGLCWSLTTERWIVKWTSYMFNLNHNSDIIYHLCHGKLVGASVSRILHIPFL